MKGIVLVLVGWFIVTASTFGESMAVDFGISTNQVSPRDAALMLRVPLQRASPTAQFVFDSRSESRGSRPSIAYTLFRVDSRFMDASLQPIFGKINGAQMQLNW